RGGGLHSNLGNSPRLQMVMEIVSIAAALVFICFAGTSRRWLVLAATVAVAYLAVMIVRRRTDRRGGMAQVRVNAAGCMQDDNPADGPNAGPLRMLAESFVIMLPATLGATSGTFALYFWAGITVFVFA